MSANLEDIIHKKVHTLPDEQQQEVLEFVDNLARRRSDQTHGRVSINRAGRSFD